MRRASTTPTLAIAFCLLLGALVPAAPAAADSRDRAIEGRIQRVLEAGLNWLRGLDLRMQELFEYEILQAGAGNDPNGGSTPPPPPPPTNSQTNNDEDDDR
jgi:hypothetical protein